MTTTVPRRRPTTEPERQRNVNQALGANTAGGMTPDARKVTTSRDVTVYPADTLVLGISAAGGISIISTPSGANGSTTAGPNAVVLGGLNSGLGVNCVSIGFDCSTPGQYAVHIGFAGSVGDFGIGIGEGLTVAANAAGFGNGVQALHAGSFVFGRDSGSTPAASTDTDQMVLGTANHKTIILGRLNVAPRTPSSTADTQGSVGDITSDDSYVYVKTSAGWKRSALSTF